MTLSGDEPMLPQPADDNAPMISGRGTRIIADARGAYLAGNLRALVEHMDEYQNRRLKQRVVQQLIFLIESSEFAELPLLCSYLQAVQSWVNNPTEEVAAAISDLTIGLHTLAPSPCVSAVGFLIRLAASNPYSLIMANGCYASIAGHKASIASLAILTNPFGRWQVEAAWAILQGKEPPTFEASE